MRDDNQPRTNDEQLAAELQAEIEATLKGRYRHEYLQAAKKELGLMDAFKSAEKKLQKITRIAEQNLQRDFENGTLEARAKADIAAEEKQDAAEAKAASPQFAPGDFDFLDITEDLLADEDPIVVPPTNYNIDIPDVPKLMVASDETFLMYVMENLVPYDIMTPGYQQCDELRALSQGKIPPGVPRPPILGTFINKQFNLVAGSIVRDEAAKGKMLLMHSDTQQHLVDAGAAAVGYFNKTGKIPQAVREMFIIEQTKDKLRTSGYPMTRQYEHFCMNVLNHIAGQLMSFRPMLGGGPMAPRQPYTLTVSYNLQTKPAAPKAEEKKPARKKKPKATKQDPKA